MKTTKFLLGSLAVMSLAACQNEDLIKEVSVSNPVLDREQIDITISPNNVKSRLGYVDGKVDWTAGDKIGACIVDPSGSLTDEAHIGNYKFDYSEAGFKTASTMSKGIYLFYYPYNTENTTTREGVIARTLPAVQEWDADGSKMLANDFLVSPVVNVNGYEGDQLTLPMTMTSIYGYGKISITNNSGEDFEIQKVVISSNEEFIIGGTLEPEDMTDAHTDLYVDLSVENANIDELFQSAYDVYYKDSYNFDSWLVSSTEKSSTLSISALNGTVGEEVKNGETKTTRVLIPAGEYTAANFTISVYTDKGVETYAMNDDDVAPSLSDSKVKVGNSLTTPFNITVNADELEPATDVKAINEDDFIAGLKQFSGSEDKVVSVTALNPLTLTQDILNQIPANVTVSFTGGSDVTFEGNMNLKNVKFVKDSGNANTVTLKDGDFNVSDFTLGENNILNIEKANVVFGENVSGGSSAITNLKSSAKLSLSSSYESYMDINGGALYINKPALEEDEETYSDIEQIYFRNIYAGEININANTIYNSNTNLFGDNVTADEDVKTDVTINIAEGVTFTATGATIGSDVEVVNNGTLTVGTNKGEIVNNATLTVSTTNTGTINQNSEDAVLTCTANAAGATINTVAYSRTTVDAEGNAGDIYYVKNARISASGTGNVVYVVPADMQATEFSGLSASITKLLFNNDFTYTYTGNNPSYATLPTSVKALEFKGDLTLGQNLTVNDGTTLSFTGTKQNIEGTTKSISSKTGGDNYSLILTLGANTELYIGAGVTINNIGTLPTTGTVWNDGTVNVNSGVSAEDGVWSGNDVKAKVNAVG